MTAMTEFDKWLLLTMEYTNDTLQQTARLHNQLTRSLTDGSYESYYIDGQLEEKGLYADDLLQGDWIGFHPNGELEYKGKLENDNRVGRWEYYYDNGNLQEVIHYNSEGQKHGENENYTRQGKLHSIVKYDNGKIIGLK